MWQWLRTYLRPRLSSSRSNRKRRVCRPTLEALETRYAPAQIVWLGTATSQDMTLASNWDGGVRPGPQDEAFFDNRAVNGAQLPENRTLEVGKLTVTEAFTRTFLVSGSLVVTTGGDLGDSTWVSSGPMYLTRANSVFSVRGSGTMEFWDGGVLGTDSASAGLVEVKSGGTLKLTGATNRFDARLQVGDGTTSGTVEIGGLNADVTNNVGGSITVSSTGTFKMTQSGASSSSIGGFLQSGGQFGTFTNAGTFIRQGTTTGAFTPAIDYVVTNTGTFEVTAGSNVKFTRRDTNNYSLINQSPGLVKLNYGAYVRASDGEYKYKQDGGVFATYGAPAGQQSPPGSGSTYFLMHSDFLGGNLYVNRDGGFGTLEFQNHNVKFGGSLTVYIEVDGSTTDPNEMADQINVGSTATLTIDNSGSLKPRLVIITLNAVPAAGWAFDVLTAGSLVGTFQAGNITFEGAFSPPGGYTVSYPLTPFQSLRITR